MEQLDEIRIPWGSGIVGYVAESGEPVNIPDAYKVSWNAVWLVYITQLEVLSTVLA